MPTAEPNAAIIVVTPSGVVGNELGMKPDSTADQFTSLCSEALMTTQAKLTTITLLRIFTPSSKKRTARPPLP